MPAATPKIVIIGPGKIGCGFVGPLFAEAGWQVMLAARSEASAARIEAAGGFTVRTAGSKDSRRVAVGAVAVGTPAFERAIAEADLVATAVGSASVPDLGEPLARALAARAADRPLDVWAIENADAGAVLDAAVRAAANRKGLELAPVGITSAIAWAIVARGDWKESRHPEFLGDGCRRLVVDATRVLNPVPRLPGVEATERYEESLAAKRLAFGAGHALCAYRGARAGHRFIHEVVADRRLRAVVHQSLVATLTALDRDRPGASGNALVNADWIMGRYANAELADPVRRVARDPLRKLAPDGPLVGAARLVQRASGRVPAGLAAGIASALAYRDPRDSQACLLARRLDRHGDVAGVLYDVSGLDPADPLGRAVERLYWRFTQASHQPIAIAA